MFRPLFGRFLSRSVAKLACVAVSLLCCVVLASASHAAAPSDVRVIIDVSGSMKQNDPQNLRRPAMDLLVQLFPAGSKAGVWTFGQYTNMLVPHDEVNDAWRGNAADKSKLVNSIALRTNIGLALEKAAYDLDPKRFPTAFGFSRSIILLTDGVVDIDRARLCPERNQ